MSPEAIPSNQDQIRYWNEQAGPRWVALARLSPRSRT